jgi:hypothetical protein
LVLLRCTSEYVSGNATEREEERRGEEREERREGGERERERES